MREHCLKRPRTIFTVKSFKFLGVLNIGNIQFFNEISGFVPKENTYCNMKEAWTLEVILARNLKGTLLPD